MTNPTPEHREQAREIALLSVPKHEKSHEMDSAMYCMDCEREEEAAFIGMTNAIAAALSSRDTEVREVLEGLSTLIHYTHGQPERCWCNNQNSNWTHTQECLAARDLYAKLQPGK